MPAPGLSVVVPTYRGAAALPKLLARIDSTLRDRWDYEVIVVDDASPDDTWDVVTSLGTTFPRLRAVQLLRNRGQSAATLCGLAHAKGALVATMDDDLQHPPEELPVLVRHLEEHPDWDCVVGTWELDQSKLRNLGSRANELVDRIAHGTPLGFRHTGFRVLRKNLAEALIRHQTRTPVLWAMLSHTTNRLHNVTVRHDPRPYGRSGYGVLYGLKIIATSFMQASTLPLRFLTGLGFISALVAFVVAVVYLARWFVGVDTPVGWASTFLAVQFFGGASLFGLGLLGEYLALVTTEVQRAPLWHIRDTVE